MSALKARIAGLIATAGPISVAEYMALCLSNPEHGYYMTRDPFGSDGDFTTAPEISQMFGELIGAWIAETWRLLGQPAGAMVVEIGPGRGTLMRDMARTLAKIAPGLHHDGAYALVETSPKLRAAQASALESSAVRFEWHAEIGRLPRRPMLIVGNELFDALPVRQYVKTGQGWRERVVDIDAMGGLRFAAGAGSADPALMPPSALEAQPGSIVELAPARSALMQRIAERIARDGGAGLFIDYGYRAAAVGDTLQAVLKHTHDDPLAHPGEADLTAHVDFGALAMAARAEGLQARIANQGRFLLSLGLLERAGALGARATTEVRERLSGEVERLAGPDAMGELFKVLAVAPQGIQLPGFPASD